MNDLKENDNRTSVCSLPEQRLIFKAVPISREAHA